MPTNKKQETPADKLVDSVCHPIPGATGGNDGLPYVTHEGIIDFGEHKIRCYIISDGRRIIDQEDALKLLNNLCL